MKLFPVVFYNGWQECPIDIPAKISKKLLWLVLPDKNLSDFFLYLYRSVFCMGESNVMISHRIDLKSNILVTFRPVKRFTRLTLVKNGNLP